MPKPAALFSSPLSPHLSSTTPALELHGIDKSFGNAKIVQDINLTITLGEHHAIIGPNGAGKSTLFDMITGKTPPSSGDIYLKKQKITHKKPYQISRMGLSRSFQVSQIFTHMSVFENIRCALIGPMGYGHSFWHLLHRQNHLNQRTQEILQQLQLQDRYDDPAGVLSYAEQRILEIGMALAAGHDILLLDEPTAGLNRAESTMMIAFIKQWAKDKTVLMIEHDMQVIFDFCDKISVLANGTIIASDTRENIQQNSAVQHAYLGDFSLPLSQISPASPPVFAKTERPV